jgi:hypothetical protein
LGGRLYLIPGVVGGLNSPRSDINHQALVYRVRIEAGCNMITQMRQDHQFEQQWSYGAWHQHLQSWIEQQLAQLTANKGT